MVPGYAMNAHILAFHPRGTSMVQALVQDGREVWTANLRGQGGSHRTGHRRRYGLGELALIDLPAALAHVRASTGAATVDVVGCSLGASMVYGYLAHHPDDHGVGAFVSVGGPLRWLDAHAALRIAFASPSLARLVPIKGTRTLAGLALPLAARFPDLAAPLLAVYMNTQHVDLSKADQLIPTVDDPVRWINVQVAKWLAEGELRIGGLRVEEALPEVSVPMLSVFANADGIVPPAAARVIETVMPPGQVALLEVGDTEIPYAHADLFIGDTAQQRVFLPMKLWLAAQDR